MRRVRVPGTGCRPDFGFWAWQGWRGGFSGLSQPSFPQARYVACHSQGSVNVVLRDVIVTINRVKISDLSLRDMEKLSL